MTIRTMELEDVIASLAQIRDWSDREAFYYRRRGEDSHDRTHAIELEGNVATLEDVLGNLRAMRTAELREGSSDD